MATINFAGLPSSTQITTQFSSYGISFYDLYSNGSTAVPETNGGGISNSPTGNYPTAPALEILFAQPVTNLSFLFNNEGSNSGFIGGGTSYVAYAASGAVVASGNLSNVDGNVALGTQSISRLVIDNGTQGNAANNGGNWIFDVDALTFTQAPTIVGTVAGQASNNLAVVQPFAHVTIGDPNGGATETLTITQAGAGTLTGSGLGAATNGVYTLTGTAAAVSSTLDGLSFTPANATPNSTVTTGFTLSDTSSAGSVPTIDATTTVVETNVSTAPTITGTAASQATVSEAVVNPFASVVIGDANNGATETLTITQSGAGALAGAGLGTPSNGVYTLTGTAAAITTMLDGLSFTPAKGLPNTRTTTGFTLSDTSTAYGPATVDGKTTVIDSDPAVAPTIAGLKARQTTTADAAITPFAGVTIGDANALATETLTITLSAGGSLAGSGLSGSGGSYTLTGTAAGVTAALDALTYTPAAGAPNSAVTATLTLSDVSSVYGPAASGASLVTDIDSAVAPTISGTKAGQTTTSDAPLKPFATATVADPNSGATDTLSIVLTGAGSLSGTGLSGSAGSYSLSGTAAAVTSALQGLTFTPAAGAAGTAAATSFTLTDTSSAYATPFADSTTSVIDTDPAPPTIEGTVAGEITTFETPVNPFFDATLGDSNTGATDIVTITLSGGGGTLTGTGLTGSGSSYTLTGTAAAVTAQLVALRFTPAAPGTTSFTLSDKSSADATPTVDTTTTVLDTDSLPVIAGAGAQFTQSDRPVNPFYSVTVTDPTAGATDVVTISLQGRTFFNYPANSPTGTLLGYGLTFANGVYTLSGTAATVTSELQALVYTPAAGTPATATTTGLTLKVASSSGLTVYDTNTDVIDSDPAVAPTISGTTYGQSTAAEAAVTPFAGVTLTDPNGGATDTLTITLSRGGTLAGTGLSGANGTYMLTGTAAAVTAELDALTFTPLAGGPNSATTNGLTLSLQSSAYMAVTTKVVASFYGQITLAGVVADAAGDLFGTTQTGGYAANGTALNDGTIYEIVKTSAGYSAYPNTIATFSYTNGAYPEGNLSLDASGNLFGTTDAGGANGYGSVFEIQKTSTGYNSTPVTVASFKGTNGSAPASGLIADAAGNLYGTTSTGGASNSGTIFEILKTTSGYNATPKTLLSFSSQTGTQPSAGLVADAAGDLFGTTYLGGAGYGTVFELAKSGTGYATAPTVLASFNVQNGSNPDAGLIIDAAGDLFGTASSTVFEIAKTASGYAAPTVLATLNGYTGSQSIGTLTTDAAGDLFGTAVSGGASGAGTVFEIAKTASGYGALRVLSSFNTYNGSDPRGGLFIDAAGNLLGTTVAGGNFNSGDVFSITGPFTPTPTLDTTTTVIDADPAVAPTITGTRGGQATVSEVFVTPFAGVTIGDPNSAALDRLAITLSAGGTLSGAGLSGGGASYTLSGSAASITSQLDALTFTPAAGTPATTTTSTLTLSDTSITFAAAPTTLATLTGANGANPYGGLVADAAGDLFGTTSSGGPNGSGTIFEIAKTASGYASTATTLASLYNAGFSSSSHAGLYIDAAGNLFGTAQSGGTAFTGTVFELAKTASGYSATPTLVASFTGANGTQPEGALVADAAGDLFGTTVYGGAGTTNGVPGSGTVFEIVKTGTGYASTPTTLTSFTGTNGSNPYAALIVDAAGDLFGTTQSGGTGGGGTVFEIAKTTTGYGATPTTLVNFNGTTGSAAADATSTLIMDAAGDLFGTTLSGGAFGYGTAFEIVKTATGYGATPTILASFGGTSGLQPYGGLVADQYGDLFGSTYQGGSNGGNGSVFEIARTSAGYTAPITLMSFAGLNGANPFGPLTIDAAGNLLGTASNGGASGEGTVFELTRAALTATDGTTTVSDTDPAVAPAITGTLAGQTTSFEGATKPFASATVADPNGGATDTLTITLSGGGALSGNGLTGSGTSYALTGTAAAVTAALQGLTFVPVAGAQGTTATTTFNLSDKSSAFATPATDATTTVTDSDVGVAPTITGTVSGQATTAEAPLKPFTGVTIGDANRGATDTLTITVAVAPYQYSGGTLTGTGLVHVYGNTYTLTGGAAAITAQLQALTFTPVVGTPAGAATDTFTLSDTSSLYGGQTFANYYQPLATTSNGLGYDSSSLIADAAGNLLGVTNQGQSGGNGAVFEIAKTSSGYASPTLLTSFTGANGSVGSYYSAPAPLVADRSANVFGTTMQGGANGVGTVFELTAYGTSYANTPTTLYTFNTAGGYDPNTGLTIDAAGDLFGATLSGTVFELAKTTSGYGAAPTTIASLAGGFVSASMIMDAAGDLFGTSAGGGANNAGTVFEIVKTAAGYNATPTTLFSFGGTSGSAPIGGLLMDAAGNLYGTTSAGGASGDGTVFELTRTASGYSTSPTTLATFTGANGSDPEAGLTFDPEGDLFGTTKSGFASGAGSIFEIAKTGVGFAPLKTLDGFGGGSSGSAPNTTLTFDTAGDLIGGTATGTIVELPGSYVLTPTVDTTTTVIDTDPAVAPVITGTVAGQGTSSETPIRPFATTTIVDRNANATDTLTITLGGAGGTLMGAGGAPIAVLSGGAGGVYTITGTGQNVTALLQSLSFTPTAGAISSTSTTSFALSYTSSASSTAAVDTKTTVIDTDPYRPPAPTVTAPATSGVEGTAIALGITAAVNTTGGVAASLASLTIGSIPVGAVLTDGTNTFKATASTTSVDVSSWTMSTLTIKPTSDADLALTVTGIEKDSAGHLSSPATVTEAITVTPLAPTLTASGGSGVEGTAIALKLSASVNKLSADTGNALASLVVSGIPAGTLLSDGTNSLTGTASATTVDVSAWTLAKPTVTPATDVDFSLGVAATSRDATGTLSTAATASMAIAVTPLAPSVAWGAASGVEGSAIALALAAAPAGASADSNTLASLVISGLGVGATLGDGTHSFTAASGATSVDIAAWSLATLTLTPSNAINPTLKATVTEKDAAGTLSASTIATGAVTVAPLAPTLTVSGVSGVEGTPIPLKIAAAVTRLGGDANSLAALGVGGLPVGMTLTDGTNSFTATTGATSVDVSAWTLATLTATPVSATNVTLTIAATDTDATGDSSATATASEHLTVRPPAPGVAWAGTPATGVEGSAIALTLSTTLNGATADGNTLASLVISALPVGAVLSDGTNSFVATSGATAVDVSGWTLSKLTVTPPSAVDPTLKATAIVKDSAGDISAASSASTTLLVTPLAPTLSVAPATGIEGAPIALKVTAAVAKLSGDANVLSSLVIGGLPAGAILSDGTNSFTATSTATTVDVTAWTVSKLTVTPAGSTDCTLRLSAVAKDAAGEASTATTASATVTVSPLAASVAWAPTPSAVEGVPLALGALSATVNGLAGDGNTLASLVISGIPAGAVLGDGTHAFTATSGATAVSVVGWALSRLTLTTPGDGDATLLATAVETDATGTPGPASSVTEVVTIAPPAPSIAWAPASIGIEGTPIALGALSATVNGVAGEGNSLASLVISGLPAGAVLSDGTNSFKATASTTSVDVSTWSLARLTVTPSNATNLSLTATAVEKDATGTTSAAVTTAVPVTVNPLAPTLTATAVSGVEGAAIALKIGAVVNRLSGDGNSLASLVVSGLPIGAVLSDGTNTYTATSGAAAVDVSAWTLSKLALTPAGDADFALALAATTRDAGGGVSAVASASEAVTVAPPAPVVAFAGEAPRVSRRPRSPSR